jgi:hypothetical protein
MMTIPGLFPGKSQISTFFHLFTEFTHYPLISYYFTVMPDTMNLNVTTPNDNPISFGSYATLQHEKIATMQTTGTLRCVW